MEQLKPQRQTYFSPEAYLEFEEAAATKHELHEGMLVDMAGGTSRHSLITTNIIRQIGNRLEGKRCFVFNGDLRVRIARTVNYYYPDLSITCETPRYDPPDRQIALINPQLILEIGSESTAAFDRREKFYNYMRIESLKEYVLIDQDRPCIDTFYRQADGVWAIGPSFEGLDTTAILRLQGGLSLPLREIYAGVEWPKPPEVSPTTADVTTAASQS